MIGIRFALYANLMLLFGVPLFGLYALKGAERVRSAVLPIRAVSIGLASSALALSALSFAAMTASMAGVGLAEVDSATLRSMLFETTMGTAWQVRIAALLGLVVVATVLRGRERATWLGLVALAAGCALASLAWTGHGAATEGSAGDVHLVADIVHLLVAGAWVGALAALIALVSKRGVPTDAHLRLTHRTLHGFSVVGTVIVALIVVSGLVNSWMLVGVENIVPALGTLYGQLLVLKLVLFAGMIGLAAANRFRLTPAFETAIAAGDAGSAMLRLRRSLVMETSAAILILALVAWLGTLQPPAAM